MDRCLSFALATFGCLLVSCDYEDDDDCHTHYYSTGLIVSHCHDDDDFDDDDFDDDDFDDDVLHLQGAPAEAIVLVTDDPAPDLRAMHVTVHRVALLSPEVKPQVIYASDTGRRLELLSLGEERGERLYEVLVGRTGLIPATFDRVELQLGAPSLLLVAGAGDAPPVDCPGGCTVEVELAEPLVLGPGELATLVVDIQVDRSLAAPEVSSPAGRWTFRPAVAVQALRDEALATVATPLEVAGIVREIDLPASRLRLELEDGAGVLDVEFGREAELGAAGPGRVALEQVEAGERASVRGTLAADGSLAASSAFLGGTFRRRAVVREVRSTPAGFRLLLEEEGSGGRFEMGASRETLVSRRRTERLELLDARPGEIATITALTAGPGQPPAAVRIDLEPPPAPAIER